MSILLRTTRVSHFDLKQGNSQMCAMLVMIASSELGISDFDAMRITDAYIGISSIR